MRRVLLIVLMLLAGGPAWALESAAVTSPRAVVTLVSETDAPAAGRAFRVALRMRLAAGWHVYWVNPGDAGVPPELVFKHGQEGGGVTAGAIAWPAPSRQPEPPLITYGYSGEVVLPVVVSGAGPVEVEASWLVCKDICVPEEGVFRLELPAGDGALGAQAALFAAADARMPRPSPWPARIAPDGTLSLEAPGIDVVDAWFAPLVAERIAAAAPQPMSRTAGGVSLALRPAAGFKPEAGLAGVLTLTDRAGQVTALAVEAVPGAAPGPGTPLAEALLFAFLGGLVLNLMPCVFPVLAMKAIGLARLGGAARSVARRQAALYAAGVMATFMVIAFTLLGLRAAGAAVGWGFQFQSPAFVAVMAAVLFGVGLNLSGLFQLGGAVGVGQGLAGREGGLGSFFAGMLAVLVATPCTAPFMGVALAAGLAAGPLVTASVFAALGAGLAAPYVVVASVPALARLLPRPGRWMDVLKQALAFPMYGAALWLIWVLAAGAGPTGVLAAGGALLLVGLAGWLLSLDGRIARGLAVVALLGAAGSAASLAFVEPAPAVASAGDAEPFSAARLAELRAAGRPVFVNMTAAWCVSCLVNERVALAREPVRAAMAAKGVVYLKGDWTRRDPALTAYLAANGADGVPLYAYYAPGKPPVILPQILTPGIVIAAIGG